MPNKHDIKTQRISQSGRNAMLQNESVLQVVDPFQGGCFQVGVMGEPSLFIALVPKESKDSRDSYSCDDRCLWPKPLKACGME